MSVLIVTEFAPEHLGAGVRRRLDHYVDAYEAAGTPSRTVSLFAQPGATFAQSVRASRRMARSGEALGAGELLFVGVGNVPMLLGARAAVRRRRGTTVFDQCDSASTQLWTSLTAANWRLVVFSLMRLVLLASAGRRLVLDYISRRDLIRDAWLNIFRSTRLTPPSVPAELLALPAADHTKVDRVVIPGDFSSSHLVRGLAALRGAAPAGFEVPVEYYGPLPPAWMLPRGTYEGFAPSLADLYRGNTVVFIPNVGGAGVPNKLFEASATGRLVIAHAGIVDRVSTPLFGWSWRTDDELRVILLGLRGSRIGSAPTRLR